MVRPEAAPVVAQPDVVAGFGEIEGQGVVVVGAVGACGLEEAVDEEDGIAVGGVGAVVPLWSGIRRVVLSGRVRGGGRRAGGGGGSGVGG